MRWKIVELCIVQNLLWVSILCMPIVKLHRNSVEWNFEEVESMFQKVGLYSGENIGSGVGELFKLLSFFQMNSATDEYISLEDGYIDFKDVIGSLTEAVGAFLTVLKEDVAISEEEILDLMSLNNGLISLHPSSTKSRFKDSAVARMAIRYVEYQDKRIMEMKDYYFKCKAGKEHYCTFKIRELLNEVKRAKIVFMEFSSILEMVSDDSTDDLVEISLYSPFQSFKTLTSLFTEYELSDFSCLTLLSKLFVFTGMIFIGTPLVCFYADFLKNGNQICEGYIISITEQEVQIILELANRLVH